MFSTLSHYGQELELEKPSAFPATCQAWSCSTQHPCQAVSRAFLQQGKPWMVLMKELLPLVGLVLCRGCSCMLPCCPSPWPCKGVCAQGAWVSLGRSPLCFPTTGSAQVDLLLFGKVFLLLLLGFESGVSINDLSYSLVRVRGHGPYPSHLTCVARP